MKKTFLILSLLCIAIASCKKKSSTPQATYEVDGVQDISMQNMVDSSKYLAIAVNHISGQTQETVTLTISGLPTGINMVTTTGSLTGIPTFSTLLTFYDTTISGATPGTYPITISCKGTESGTKTFSFNLTITAAPAYISLIVGNYTNCTAFAITRSSILIDSTILIYNDSIYADPTSTNKIWFNNFLGMTQKVYGTLNGSEITIPNQTVNGYSFSSSGYGDIMPTHEIVFGSSSLYIIKVTYNSDTSYASLSMIK